MSHEPVVGDNTASPVEHEADDRPLARERFSSASSDESVDASSPDVPPFDAAEVGRVARRVQVIQIDLVAAHFERVSAGALPDAAGTTPTPGSGVDVEWNLSEDGRLLGCLLTFGTTFDQPAAPYSVIASFRLVYTVADEPEELTPDQLAQFAHWNAVFNAWPYWREYLASTINRAHLPQFTVPVLGVPRFDT